MRLPRVLSIALAVTVLGGSEVESQTRRSSAIRAPGGYGCIVCHVDKRREFNVGVHADAGIKCHNCHGGDTTSADPQAAHRGNFIGHPDKLTTVTICSDCHADTDEMRQYGLPADQLAELRSSRHGQLLLVDGNEDAPTCTDCHNAHRIFRADDARSEVHPTNIPLTCAVCHEDSSLMDEYGLPIDQYELYREGAHGTAVFERENLAAPTCIGCHGSHAALPPGAAEIENVCGKCHVLVQHAFRESPHEMASQRRKMRACLACHNNHGTNRTPPEQLTELCASCHASDQEVDKLAQRLEATLVHATTDLERAEEAIQELRLMGHNVSEARFRYQTALTNYRQLALAQHSFDLEQMEDLSRKVSSVSQSLRTEAEVVAEERWEHKLVLIPVWFLALSAIAFAWFKLRGTGA